MKKLAVFVFILAVTCHTSCHPGSRLHYALKTAATQIETRPDGALAILQSIDSRLLSRKSARARYALLYSQALDKNWIDLASDSIIAPAVAYYSKHGNPREKAYANYYLGCIHYNAGHTDDAVRTLIRAETYANSYSDFHLLARVYNCLGGLYLSQHSLEEADSMFRLAESYYRIEQDSLNVGYMHQNKAMVYSLQDRSEVAISEYRKALKLFHSIDDHAQISLLWRCIVTEMQEESSVRIDSMKLLLWQAYRDADFEAIPIEDYSMWAWIYLQENKIDSARHFGQGALNDPSISAHKRCGTILQMCRIEEALGNYQAANNLWLYYYASYDSIVTSERRCLIQQAERKYHNLELTHTNRLLRIKNRYVNIGWGAVLIVSLSLLILFYVREIRKYRQYIDALNVNYEDFKARYTRLSQELNGGSREEINLLNAFDHLLVRFHNLLDRAYKVAGPKNYIKEFKDYAMSISRDKNIFADLQYVANKRHYGLISHLHAMHPDLTGYELDMLCMLQCGFSLDCIRLLHRHENTYSIYSRRTKIHKKLGLPPHKKIEEYLAELVEELEKGQHFPHPTQENDT